MDCTMDTLRSVRFCSRSIRKALEWWARKPCKRPTGTLLAFSVRAAGSPANQPPTSCSHRAVWGRPRQVSPATEKHPPTKKPPKIGDTVGYTLKSSFYQSCLILFNKSVLFKWLWLSEFYPGPSILWSHWVTVFFKKIIKQANKQKQMTLSTFHNTWNV